MKVDMPLNKETKIYLSRASMYYPLTPQMGVGEAYLEALEGWSSYILYEYYFMKIDMLYSGGPVSYIQRMEHIDSEGEA